MFADCILPFLCYCGHILHIFIILLELWKELEINGSVELSILLRSLVHILEKGKTNKQNLITSYPLCPLPHVSLYIAYQGLVNTLYKGSKASVSGSVGTMGSVATAQICCYRAKATTAIHEEIGMAIFQ